MPEIIHQIEWGDPLETVCGRFDIPVERITQIAEEATCTECLDITFYYLAPHTPVLQEP